MLSEILLKLDELFFGKTATNWEPTHFHLFSPMLSMQISKPSRRPSVEAIRSTCKQHAWSSIAHCKKYIGHTQLLSSPTRTPVLQNHCYKYFSKAVLHCQCVLHLLKMPNDWRYVGAAAINTNQIMLENRDSSGLANLADHLPHHIDHNMGHCSRKIPMSQKCCHST